MMNCANQIRDMSLWEYEARLFHWNEAHRAKDDVAPPDPETTMKLIALANLDPRLTN